MFEPSLTKFYAHDGGEQHIVTHISGAEHQCGYSHNEGLK
jgi:hypothetical protein